MGDLAFIHAESFPIIISYMLPFQKMLERGKYDIANEDDFSPENFPVVGSGICVRDAFLCCFTHPVGAKEAREQLNDRELQPGAIEELLAVGRQYPEFQNRHPIIALGSSWRRLGALGFPLVPCLSRLENKRSLSLLWENDVWDPTYRFLAVFR